MLVVTPKAARGFSIIEFMIAITLSLLVLAALTAAFVSNSRSRTEIERANEQVENGRFALQLLGDDLELAGFYSHLNLSNVADSALPDGLPPPAAAGNPWTGKPNPCSTTISGWNTTTTGFDWAIKMHIQGYDSPSALDTDVDDCVSDFKANTDIVVIRRAATCVAGAANCAVTNGAPYIQASLCATELNQLDPRNYLRIAFFSSGSTASPNRTLRDCATTATARQYMTNIYFVANNDKAGDGIPTLKRAELGATGGAVAFSIVPLAHGIQDLQLEYGIDTSATPDGVPDVFTASPDRYNRSSPSSPYATCAAAASNCIRNWRDTVAVRLSVLARNTTQTRDYVDSKIYTLGNNFAGTSQCALDANNDGTCEAFNDKYKRHVYSTSVRLNNPAGRREQ